MKKLLVRLLNIVYLAGAAVALTGLATQPLLKVDLSVGIPGQFISDLVKDKVDGEKEEKPKTSEVYLPKISREPVDTNQFDFNEILSKIDLEGVFEGLSINASVKLPSFAEFMGKTNEQKTAVIADSLESAINNTKEDVKVVLTEGLTKLVPEVAKAAASTVITQSVAEEIAKVLDVESIDDPAVKAQVEKIESTVNEMVGDVWTEIVEGENPTVDSVFDIVENNVNEVFEVLAQTDPSFNDVSFNEEDLEPIKEQMTEMLQQVGLADEDGNIQDPEAALAEMIKMFMGSGEEEDEPEQEQQPETKAHIVRAEETSDSDIEAALGEFVDSFMDELPLDDIANINLDELTGITNMTMYAYAGLTLLAALPWLLFALITIIRTLRPRKCWTKPWVVFVFAFLELILGIGLFCFCKFGLSAVVGSLSSGASGSYASLLTGNLSLGIKFHCFWASIVYVAMIPFTIVYIIFAHGAKKEFKQYKKEKKAAKKAAKKTA